MLFNKRKLLQNKDLLGRWGEKQAERFLKKQGLRVLCRNYSCKSGEIDLIMIDIDSTIAFIEVKTRVGEEFSEAESAINYDKKTKLINTARYFRSTNNIEERPLRFDVVAIVLNSSGSKEIRHYKNAFVP